MMLKKLSLVFTLTLAFSLLFVNNDFAQVKKAPVKKTTTVKRTTTVTNKTTVKKAAPVVATAAPEVNAATAGSIRVRIITDSGTMIVKLYDATPLHRDNFVKLVSQGFYDSLLFHRVIAGFMIQGGDPMSKNATSGSMLGMGGGDMTRIPAEFNKGLVHTKGVLAAARDGNPEKASSACQFYIVDGSVVRDEMLNMLEQQKGIKYTAAQRKTLTTVGGTPMLDQEYTVFGEVESGMEVIAKIANVQKDGNNRPLGDVHMRMELVK